MLWLTALSKSLPAFDWWGPHTLHERNRMISKVNSRCWRMTHKFGIRLPHSVEEALEIDGQTGKDFWRKVINKEMSKVEAAWRAHKGHTPKDVHAGCWRNSLSCQQRTDGDELKTDVIWTWFGFRDGHLLGSVRESSLLAATFNAKWVIVWHCITWHAGRA